MKKITKALSLVMIMTLCIFTLTACGGSDDANAGADTEKEAMTTLVFGTSADYAPFEFMYPDENGDMDTGYGLAIHADPQLMSGCKKGQLLLEVDLEAVKAAGLPTITPVLICNTDAYPTFKTHVGKEVSNEDVVIELGK